MVRPYLHDDFPPIPESVRKRYNVIETGDRKIRLSVTRTRLMEIGGLTEEGKAWFQRELGEKY